MNIEIMPMQRQSPFFLQKSAYNTMPSICHCGSSFVNDMEWWLPVSRRGHFFHDSFFENARKHFDAAVKDALCKWGEMEKISDTWKNTSSLIDNLSHYRKLRSSKQLEDSLATTYVSENNTYKIVMDIHAFKEGDIKVKVVGEKEIFVEGKEHGSSSYQNFSRRFLFPESVDISAVTSVMSSDGVLTIEAPVLKSTTKEKIIPIQSSTEDAFRMSKRTQENASQYCNTEESNKVFYCKECNKKIRPWLKEREFVLDKPGEMRIPIKIEDTISGDPIPSAASASSSNLELTSHTSDVKNITTEREEDHANIKSIQPIIQNPSYTVPISTYFNTLPIIRRGLFFNDSFFEDMRKDFALAVKEVLSKWGDESSAMDDMTRYRNLRSLDLREENQAAKVIESEKSHKVILDVQDFMNGGDITIKAINDRELIIEGQLQKQSGNSSAQKKFSKRFVFPREIQLDAVTSVMSSDGVLTVTAPIKETTLRLKEYVIPMSIEEVKDKNDDKKNATNTICETVSKQVKESTCSVLPTADLSSNKKDIGHVQTKASTSSSTGVAQLSLDKENKRASNEHIIPVQLAGEGNTTSNNTVVREVDIKKEHQDKQVSSSHNQENISSDGKKNPDMGLSSITLKSTAATSDVSTTLQQIGKLKDSSERAKATTIAELSSSPTKGKTIASPSGSQYLPITRRGSFFSDSFFQDYHEDFQEAVTEVLVKCRENISESEMMNTYRNLRQRHLRVENQALKVHEDESSFRVVLDVKDFTDGDITVYVEGEELVLEGRAERSERKATDTLTFSHRFLLPEVTDFRAITSAISSDGVLTVNSPKNGSSSEGESVRKMSSVAESKHESHEGERHLWESKKVKESTQQSKGFTSHSFASSSQSQQQHSSKF